MPPSRHNPNPNSPGRRPRVAGLRKPGESSERPTPRPRPTPPEQADESPEQQASGQHEAEQPERHPEPRPRPDAEVQPDAEPQPAGDDTARVDAEPAEAGSEEAAEAPASKPSPRRKQRSASSDKPAAEQELVGAAAPGTPPARLIAARPGKKRRRLSNLSRKGTYILAAALLVLAGLFATGAVFAKMGYSDLSKATSNSALLNVSKTQEVKKAMKSAAEQLFSFDYRNIGKTEQAAKKLLANKDVQRKYGMLMDEVKRLAPKQKIVVTVKATEAAVVELNEDSAKVMVYVDQTSTRTKSGQSSAGGAALWFKTELQDGKWKVVDMDTYNSGNPMQPKKQGGQQQGGKQQGGQQQGGQKPQPPKPSGN